MTSPVDVPVPAEFDAHAFWHKHRQQIVLGLALLVAGLLIFAISQIVTHNRNESAQRLLSEASEDAGKLAALIRQYPSTSAAGDARLMLAAALRKEKKFDESVATLREFIARSPNHPLISGAWLSLGMTYEAQGKLDEALNAYRDVAAKFPDSYSAPLAMLAQANILRTRGTTEESRRTYENLMAQFPDSLFAREAQMQLRRLPK
jgi:TolA-binding protein